LVALFACALLPDPEERKRKDAEVQSRRKKLERQQAEKREEMKARGISHLYDRKHYKPAAAYLAPEKREQPTPANVQPIRKAKR
jgi:hypothetical protein